MKITVVADVLGEENNGTTITIKRLVNGLAERGHEVRVVSPLKNDESVNPKYYAVKRRTFGVFDNYITKTNGADFGVPDEKIIREAIEGADVVHIELPFKMGKCALKICKELNIPFTTAFHCQPENVLSHVHLQNSRLASKMMYDHFRKTFYKNVDFIHCPTEFIKEELEKNKYKAKKYPISNGVVPTYHKMDVEKPDEFKDKFVILFVGRLSREKRHDLLVKAMKYSKYADKIQLIFAGRGPLENEIRKQAEGLKNKLIIGFYSKEELAKIINYCDLYVHPSDVEIEAISCIEAITCGLVPVISDSKKSATRFFAQDERSLFKAGDPKDLAKKIDYWIENEDEKKRMSEVYSKYATKFNIENSIDAMISMFNDAIASHNELTNKESSEYNKEKKVV